jgi:cysteine sulfinate desulfinase/cysteine desulfurase-like protein
MRFSLSRMTTQDEIDRAVAIIVDVVKRLRAIGGPSKEKTFIPTSQE